MRDQQLVPCQPRPWRVSLTDNDGGDPAIPDLVNRDFTADTPGQKMVGDITYIPTWEGWLYLATVIDCHTKAVIGYAMNDHYKTPLIIEAICMAARNIELPDNAIFHSDRGSNYTSDRFARELTELGIHQSVGRTGICYDNAMAESLSGSCATDPPLRARLSGRRPPETATPNRDHVAPPTRPARAGLSRCTRRLRDLLILADEPAEAVAPANLVIFVVARWGSGREGAA
jgi:putative transposase